MSALLEAAIAAGPPRVAEASRADAFGALQALATLALLAAAAWLVWRLRQRSLVGAAAHGRLAIEERVRLDLRSGLVIVRIDDRRLLLATSEHGPARLIAELASDPRSRAELGASTHTNVPPKVERA
jgi:flagellar biogenesis protein FliO